MTTSQSNEPMQGTVKDAILRALSNQAGVRDFQAPWIDADEWPVVNIDGRVDMEALFKAYDATRETIDAAGECLQ